VTLLAAEGKQCLCQKIKQFYIKWLMWPFHAVICRIVGGLSGQSETMKAAFS
jgi:hypothetical protein